MKTTFWFVAVLLCLALARAAQSQAALADTVSADSAAALQLGEIGNHHRVWQRVTVETDRFDNKIYRTNAAYTELETGMNVKQPDGSWVAASDEIEIVKEGAVARKGRHRVGFAVNCNSPVAIDMVTADGKRLQSRILGLSFLDTATGNSVLIAELKDSEGQLLMDTRNEVVYPDAFTDLLCDIRYKNTKAGLEQDIILRENPPSPADYKLNPATTVLEVLTEFFNPPVPQTKERIVDGAIDQFLDFGDLQMGNGRVYVLDKESAAIPVTKQWGTLEGRTFLVEQIPFKRVEPELNALPSKTASLKTSSDGVLHQVSVKRLLPPLKQAKQANGPMRLASAPLSGKGIVLDYIMGSSETNFTFASDTIYYVSGAVNLTGTNTTFEGGVVIKYAPTNTPKLNITTPITWQGSMYRPVVMTARDDNTVGALISGSTGNPYTNYFASPALYIDGTAAGTNAILQNLRISFARSAIVFNGKTGHVVSHAQLVNCASGLTATNAEFSLRNALLYNVLTNFNGSSATGRCEHITVNTAHWLNHNSAITLTMTNSLLVGVSNGGGFTSNSVSTATASAFQTVGAGSHYLADNTYRNAGTTNINASLAADLKQLTTFPPIELTSNFTLDTTLAPQAGRDTDTPDLGWHYDPLDFVAKGRSLTKTLLLTNGVALGTYGPSSSYGISMGSGGKVISEGSPTRLNWIARYNTVQEQATTNWSNTSVAPALLVGASTAQGLFRFTGWSVPGGAGDHFNGTLDMTSRSAFTDCQFGGGTFTAYPCAVGLTNCLWNRVYVTVYDLSQLTQYYLFNNLFRGGTLDYRLLNSPTGSQIAKDNLFDKTTITKGPTGADFTHGYNAYVTNANRLTPNGTGDVILTNNPVYLSGFLGRFYYPTNGGLLSNLLNAGSRNATNATLYHYTVTTNQVKEATSTVDIGFHYVALANGVPFDTDGDGSPDYLEDRNGDGSGANDSTSWQTYNSPNGLTGGAGLQVFTPLK